MEKKWKKVYNYLSSQSYPGGYDKSKRQNLRRLSSKFKIRGSSTRGAQRILRIHRIPGLMKRRRVSRIRQLHSAL
ncbi:copper homeostasis protein cutC isoform X1, partial [Clarias magur]